MKEKIRNRKNCKNRNKEKKVVAEFNEVGQEDQNKKQKINYNQSIDFDGYLLYQSINIHYYIQYFVSKKKKFRPLEKRFDGFIDIDRL